MSGRSPAPASRRKPQPRSRPRRRPVPRLRRPRRQRAAKAAERSVGNPEKPIHPHCPRRPSACATACHANPGDRLLARLLASSGSRPLPLADLARLLDAVQGRIQVASAAESHAARLQVQLPQLGAVEVQVLHGHGQLQIEISASPGSLALLQQARGELLERLQRLHPEQPVQLTFNQQQDSGQRSRQRRYLHEEWQAE